jgi:hypothetical protein
MKSLPRHSAESSETPLQRNVIRLFEVLGDVRELDERERLSFAAIGRRAMLSSLGAELLIDEAERALAEAA